MAMRSARTVFQSAPAVSVLPNLAYRSFSFSGFLITKLLLAELDASGRISLKAFHRRRILRIFPAFHLYWLVMLLLTAGGLLTIPWQDW
jgi:peptidoglycan/LPS O-acetylase OafA/YrhL